MPKPVPTDRLSTLDSKGGRIPLYPAMPRGRFRAYRTRVQVILILIFLGLPWIHIHGKQALLLDLPKREFTFFGLTLYAHDAPLIFFVLGILTLGLAFVTAVWGRVWCGWACPQTVFIDGVFRRIEKWVEGSHIKRRKLDQAPWTAQKVFKKTLKWTLFILTSLVLTHSFLAYFVGAERLIGMVTSSPKENWTSFLFILVTTGLVLFDFAWFREQFCIIVCPYGRFQSVLMTSRSLAVLYDEKRGEPRRGKDPHKQGDCVDCFKCVNVCPTGIDIRNGIQMECIACTSCIDACDEVMTKLKKPRGLIRYSSEAEMQGQPKTYWRPRAFIYLTLILLMVVGLGVGLSRREAFNISIVRSHDLPYKKVANQKNTYLNHFNLYIKNQTNKDTQLQVSLLKAPSHVKLIFPFNPLPLKANENKKVPFFLEFQKQKDLPSQIHIQFQGQGFQKTLPLKILAPL
ncbi:MAG: cytochrome c oxidase accessory protein CcoG [Bdellovibrio sp.]|nr:MAG: cytochrome c oxidase accessory protein CcoG [Bdellovibrio sp.]